MLRIIKTMNNSSIIAQNLSRYSNNRCCMIINFRHYNKIAFDRTISSVFQQKYCRIESIKQVKQNISLCGTHKKFSTISDNNEEILEDKQEAVSCLLGEEVIGLLNPCKNKVFLDMTFGDGGHTKRLLDSSPKIKVVTLDRDMEAYRQAINLQQKYPRRLFPLLGKFSNLERLLSSMTMYQNNFDGIIIDLGVSELQMKDQSRGFDVNQDSLLDLRLDGTTNANQPTGTQLLKYIDKYELNKILKYYGGERNSLKISNAFMEHRHMVNINSTTELKNFLTNLMGKGYPANSILKALRRFVNNELNEFDYAFRVAHHFLKIAGVLVVMTYCPIEEKIVNKHFIGKQLEMQNDDDASQPLDSSLGAFFPESVDTIFSRPWDEVFEKPIIPPEDIRAISQRAATVRLRAATKVRDVYDFS